MRRIVVTCVVLLLAAVANARPPDGVPDPLIGDPPTTASNTQAQSAEPGELLTKGRYVEAIDAARDRIAASPEAMQARLVLAEALTATGKYQQALAVYAEIPPGPEGPRLDVEVARARIERVHVNSPEWRQRLEGVLSAYRDRRSALSAVEMRAAGDAAWDLAPEDPTLYSTALNIYEQAIKADPDNPAFHVAIGDLLLDRYNNEEALEAYRAALALESGFVPALFGVARSQHFDHSSGAVDAARHVLEAQPNHVGALTLLARLHIELEDYAQAQSLITRALNINPRSPDALTLSAAIAVLSGDNEGYESRVNEIRKSSPGYTGLFETLAEIAAQNRFYARAERFALWAVNLNPNSWRGYALLGVNRLRLGEMDAGRAALEIAFRGDPFDPRTKNALELLDVLDDYDRTGSERFVFVAHPREMRVLRPRVLPIAEEAYDFFSKTYGHSPRTPIRIEFYQRHEDFSVRTVGLVGVDILGVSFGPVVALDSPSAGVFGPLNFGSTLWHEIAHSFHLSLTNSRVPRWFSEGLAVLEERRAREGWGFDVSPGFLLAFDAGRLAPASALNQAFLRPTYPDQIVHAYFQGALLMEMIQRDHGFEAIVRMLEGYRDGSTTHDLIREVLAMEPGALDQAFEAYIRERFGHALAALSPAVDDAHGNMPDGRYPFLIREARRAMKAEDLDRALIHLTEAQMLFPEHAGPDSTYPMLAALYLERGETALAMEQLGKAIAIDADDLDAHRRLAGLKQDAGDLASAADVIDRALLIQPFDATLYRTLAGIRESLGDWRRAALAREAVVALDPADPAEAQYLLARAHHRAGDLPAARRALIGALELAPMYEEALELLLTIREAAGA